MANPEHLEILKQGAEQWNKWRRGPRDEEPARRRATLRKAKFSEREIVWATDWVDLSGANLVLQLQISDKLNSLWDVVLRSLPWRSDYRDGSVSCCGRMA